MADCKDLILMNRGMRYEFAAQADSFTDGNYPVRIDDNTRFLTWHYMFRKYVNTVEMLSLECPSITKLVEDFEIQRLWQGRMQSYLDSAVDFLDKNKQAIAEASVNGYVKSNFGFMFIDTMDGYQICYAEDFKIPGFSNIAMQIDDAHLAKISTDYLGTVPGDCLYDGTPRLVAVKLLSKEYNPRKYLIKVAVQANRGLSSLPPNPKIIQRKNGR
ncbi:MAG: hypothetical protein LBJ73_01445 [Rickettsiales bacterium]|jgi:hypothetical protein|nr:hypothetical protein [Rickettsiales bacterium]